MSKKRSALCIRLLMTFSNKEVDGLEKILSCEYFNTDRWIKKLLKVLKKYVLKSGVFDDDMQCIVYREVFDHLPVPKDTLSKNERNWLNQKLNGLMRLAELFLSVQQIKNNDDHKCELLYPELLAREQYQSFERYIRKDKILLDKQSEKGARYYSQKYKIEKVISNYIHLGSKTFSKENNLQNLMQNLDMSYALDKLEIQTAALSTKYRSSKTEHDFSSMEAINPLLDLPQYAEDSIIKLYRANINLMQTTSEAEYANLLNLLDSSESIVPNGLLRTFYTAATNYCVGQIKKGKLEYNEEMFRLFKKMDEKKLLIDRGIIRPIKLKNLVTIGCRVEKYDWAKNAVERYRPYISKEIREDVYHFNLGTIAFHQKDYEAAHNEYIKVNKVNKTYDTNARIAILKCLYETETDPMSYDYMMKNFRSTKIFFKENKSLPTKDKRGYINFIEILVKIYRLRHNVNATKANIERIREGLNAQKLNSDKRWLLEKIKELEEKL